MRRASLLLSSLLLACPADDGAPAGGSGTGTSSGSAGTSASATGPTATATMSASDPATSSPTESADGSAGTTAPADTGTADTTGGTVGQGEVRFVAMGDAGEGNEGQYAVAEAIRGVCEERGCDFALYLGDNFYDTGVTSTMDEQFEQKFELPYAALDFPFMVTLGNHDYGTLANEWAKSQYYIEYSEQSDKWVFPDEYYSFQEENVHFISLDTSQIFWSYQLDEQAQFIQQDLAGLQDTWVIMFGHHPYISNGEHGNAGNYEGLGALLGGQSVKDFFDESVCGKAHVYICGHDHNRQWLAPQCGTEFIVSGGGAKLTEFVHRDDNRTIWEDDQSEGFLWVEIIDNNFTGVFYDRNGVEQYEGTITL
jgi:tartrate-resistant acid phosphatase type 5